MNRPIICAQCVYFRMGKYVPGVCRDNREGRSWKVVEPLDTCPNAVKKEA